MFASFVQEEFIWLQQGFAVYGFGGDKGLRESRAPTF
jgi:hypothetical protein